ncbi:MAG: alpha/beta hydrolase [Acidobacteria bacterium]|jgi:pimeloyl-ACP methyl ester carboxylesterase|nr:MAG: alpha/beta hydrolase [Acidobacteriota bacterium]GIU82769.1 MAG: alpha/beta hydrolase [Pyrinomonadaceae bacterium]
MSKKIIHFAHANGFPALSYKKLFSELADEFDIFFLERHGHNPEFPVTDNWTFLKDELRVEIEKRYTEPVIGVGHSLGGILHLLVSVERPDLYEQIVLLDSPIISRPASGFLKLAKKTRLIEKFSPAGSTKFRKNFWQSREEAFEYFKNKPRFRDFDTDVLKDYIQHGLVQNNSGFELFFNPLIETKIYLTIPDNLPEIYEKISVPFSFIKGSRSLESRLAGLAYTKKHPLLKAFLKVKGSHLFPFENPTDTARAVKKAIKMTDFD